jgi:hypothetical protein
MMKKILLIGLVVVAFLVSGFSVYSYVQGKNRYMGQSVVPEQRKDLPLFEGLKFEGHEYVIPGNHSQSIYKFYKEKLPENGWRLLHMQMSLEAPGGGFMLSYEKGKKELFIHGGWFPQDNRTEVIFDLHPIIETTDWIRYIPKEICVYRNSKADTCTNITDTTKINQFVEWINEDAYDKDDAPVQEEYGVVEVNGEKIEIHYDPKLDSFTLKSDLGRKEMKPEPLLELTGLTHLKEK